MSPWFMANGAGFPGGGSSIGGRVVDRRGFLAATAGMAAGAITRAVNAGATAREPVSGGAGVGKARSPRPVTVAAVSGGLESHVAGRASTVKENVDRAMRCIDKLASCKPDLVVLTECFHCAHVGGRVDANALLADDEIVQRVSAQARQVGAHIIAPVYERRGDREAAGVQGQAHRCPVVSILVTPPFGRGSRRVGRVVPAPRPRRRGAPSV